MVEQSGRMNNSNHLQVDSEREELLGKDSHTARLKQILDEPALRSLFREFLRANFCEENLSFWLDVEDFKRRFHTTSSAVAAPGTLPANRGQGVQVMEKHQQDLISMAFVIFNSECCHRQYATKLRCILQRSSY